MLIYQRVWLLGNENFKISDVEIIVQLVAEFGGGNLQHRGSLCSCCSCMGHIHFVYCTLQPPQLRKVAVVPELNFGGFINW